MFHVEHLFKEAGTKGEMALSPLLLYFNIANNVVFNFKNIT